MNWPRWVRRLSAGCLLAAALVQSAFAEWHEADADIMGTRVNVRLWHEDAAVARSAIAEVMGDMRRIDRLMSPWIETSELYQLNSTAADAPVEVSDELFALLEKALAYSRLSDGAFDITFASVGFFYDYREKVAPSEAQLSDHLDAIDYRSVQLDPSTGTVTFTKAKTKIDLGGIAKGHAVDRGIAILKQAGIVSAVVSAGGDSRILGDRWGKPWMMGVRHPRKGDEDYAVLLPVVDTAISTSGDYERFFMRGDERIHHIISPKTGQSARGIQSATILAPTATQSDALSTTVFVLGVKKGLQLVNRLEGVDAVIIDAAGRLHYSADLLMSSEPGNTR